MHFGASLFLSKFLFKDQPGILRNTTILQAFDIVLEFGIVCLAEQLLKLSPGLRVQAHSIRFGRISLTYRLLCSFYKGTYGLSLDSFLLLSSGRIHVRSFPLLQIFLGAEPDHFTLLINLIDDKVTESMLECAIQLHETASFGVSLRCSVLVKELDPDIILTKGQVFCDLLLVCEARHYVFGRTRSVLFLFFRFCFNHPFLTIVTQILSYH